MVCEDLVRDWVPKAAKVMLMLLFKIQLPLNSSSLNRSNYYYSCYYYHYYYYLL